VVVDEQEKEKQRQEMLSVPHKIKTLSHLTKSLHRKALHPKP